MYHDVNQKEIRSKTTGMELQNRNSATAQNKIQTDHDEDIETEIGKQITKNSAKTHPKNTMQKKAQNEPKTAGCEPDGRNGAKIRKRGLFHSPIFHITCIIRNLYDQKIRPSTLSPQQRSEKNRRVIDPFPEGSVPCYSGSGVVSKYAQIAS